VPSTGPPCIRGVALVGLLRAAERFDPDAAAAALEARASPALRRTLEACEPRTWYPAQAHFELLDLLLHHVAGNDPTVLAEFAREAIRRDLRGVYRMLLRVMSPAWVVARADRFLAAYLNYGRVEIEERSLVGARLRFVANPSTEAFWNGLCGSIRGALESAGAEHPRVIREPSDEPHTALYRLSWS